MDKIDVEYLAYQLMKSLGVKYSFMFKEQEEHTAAQTFRERKTIEFDPFFINNPPFVIKHLLLHEIAHAIVFERPDYDPKDKEMSHGKIFQDTAKSIGFMHGGDQNDCWSGFYMKLSAYKYSVV